MSREKYGTVEKKILLLLAAGVSLSCTRRPDRYFQIIRSAGKEWRKINQRSLREAVKRLYGSQLIDFQENKDGTIKMVLEKEGEKKSLEYSPDSMRIKRQPRWDQLWRMVLFDIPEHKKKERNAFAARLKQLGLRVFQKSVFIYPFDCKNEVDFFIELFDLRSYVRFIVVKEIDNVLHLKQKFNLS